MMDMGVARPSAQGQAMMSTATALTSACCKPTWYHAAKVTMATRMTAGTNQAETRSASRWMGARLRCASPTMRTICESRVSLPTRSAPMTNVPWPLTVPPVTRSPGAFPTGMDSPVTIDSSTALLPSSTRPSTGTFSPGRTRSRSPTWTSASGTSSSPAGVMRRAVRGARSRRARTARPVSLRLRTSSTWPSSTSVVMPAAASKYTSWSCSTVATTL